MTFSLTPTQDMEKCSNQERLWDIGIARKYLIPNIRWGMAVLSMVADQLWCMVCLIILCGMLLHQEPRTKKIWKLFYWFQLDWKSIANLLEQGSEGGRMHAVFLMRDEGCHYSPKESRKTRCSRNSSRGRSNQRNTSRSRSRARYWDQTWRLIRFILCHWQSISMSAFRADLFSRVSQIHNNQTNEQDLNI